MKSILHRKSTQILICLALVAVVTASLVLQVITASEFWRYVWLLGTVALIAASVLIGVRSMSLVSSIEARTKTMEGELSAVEKRTELVESQLGAIGKRAISMDTQLKRVNYRTSAVKTQLADVYAHASSADAGITEITKGISATNLQLENIDGHTQSVQSQLANIRGYTEPLAKRLKDMDASSIKTEGKLEELSNNTASMASQLKAIDYRTSSMKAQLKDVDNRATSMESVLRSQSDDLIQTSGRVKKLYPVVHNTAGSVGEMSPIVREIASGVAEVKKLSATSATNASQVQATKPGVSDKASKAVNFPPVDVLESFEPTFPVNAMVIADDFTASAFAYEWNQFAPTKSDWLTVLNRESIDLLFVESAWVGNSGEWTYQLVGGQAPRPEIIALVDECKSRGIPTVFWNKEDPPHFEEFLKTAALFDYVFTTDVNKIPEYKAKLGHDRIDILPFAAQPKIHNPSRIRGVSRTNDVVFGGMYFRDKYPERRQQMDFLLPAAAKFKLDIYSRQLGGDEKYQFPEPFNKAVRGSLEYPSMLTAYHAYKVVLNVNSVIDSESMCARRIFEATACGAAVVSSESPAVSAFYPDDLITVVGDEKSAYHKMRILLRSDDFRDRKVHLAQRLTWEKYTYKERVKKVLQVLGMEVYAESDPIISVITPTVRPENLETIFRNFSQQTYSNRELLICCHGFDVDERELRRLSKAYGVEDYRAIGRSKEFTLADNLNTMIEMAKGDVIARMDDDDWYGPNYLLDLHNALEFSQADVVGKAASYIYFEESDMTVLTKSQMEHKYSDFVRGATIMGRKETFARIPFPNGKRGEDSDFLAQVLESGGRIYSADRFNFSVSRLKAKESHTWSAADDLLFGTGEMKYLGRALEQIQI